MGYLDDALATRQTPQSEAIPGSNQVANNAGGFAWAVDDRARVRRFLILGSEDGSYYQGERELTKENIAAGLRMRDSDGEWLVNEIVSVSLAGRAAKVQPAIFLLAAACAAPDITTKRAAFRAIPVVCRTGTHLFTFCRYVEQFRGWGRGLKSAVADWYYQDTSKLALQAVKYRQREGWSHRDVLRLTHPRTKDVRLEAVWRFMLGLEQEGEVVHERVIEGFHRAQASLTPKQTAQVIADYALSREAVRPEHLTEAIVWEALLHAGEHGMPMHALVRNLGNMSKAGLLDQMSMNAAYVVQRLREQEQITRSRLHPLSVLTAMLTYGSGKGYRSTGTWPVNGQIVQALDGAFYLAFGNVQPTGKPTMLALDTSGSMWSGMVGGVMGLSPALAAAAMCLVTANVEPLYGIYGFTTTLKELPISAGQRLDDVLRTLERNSYNGGTDCARPMLYAQAKAVEVETFVIYTDNETWAGHVHPKQALDQYRTWKPGARCAVVGMTSGGFSIADPNDAGMMDLVGFDTSTPEILRAFSAGELA